MATQIQLLPGWAYNIPSRAPIGGVDPTLLTVWRGFPLAGTAMMIGVEGPSWATVESYIVFPPIPSLSVKMSVDVTIDAPSLAALAVVEIDLKRVLKGKMCNFSQQRLLVANLNGQGNPANAIQLSKQDGTWGNAGFIAPAFQPNVPLHHDFYYGQSTAGSYGTEAVNIGGELIEVHPDSQGLAPTATTWPDGEYIQCAQITLAQLPTGQTSGRACILVDNISTGPQ